MSKQLMIYDNIQPLSERHLKWSARVNNHEFITQMNACPLLTSEILMAAPEFPIIFSATQTEGEFLPLAVMGLKDGQNLMLNEKNTLITRYIPAFVRRYPFVLGGSQDDEMMAVCIDEDSKAFDKNGVEGSRLFLDDGSQSDFLKEVINFLQDYQQLAEMSRVFTKKLYELGLLEPMSATISFSVDDSKLNLSGFFVVKKEKLKAISDAELLDLFKKDGLELIYAHLHSIPNFHNLINIMSKQLS